MMERILKPLAPKHLPLGSTLYSKTGSQRHKSKEHAEFTKPFFSPHQRFSHNTKQKQRRNYFNSDMEEKAVLSDNPCTTEYSRGFRSSALVRRSVNLQSADNVNYLTMRVRSENHNRSFMRSLSALSEKDFETTNNEQCTVPFPFAKYPNKNEILNCANDINSKGSSYYVQMDSGPQIGFCDKFLPKTANRTSILSNQNEPKLTLHKSESCISNIEPPLDEGCYSSIGGDDNNNGFSKSHARTSSFNLGDVKAFSNNAYIL